jgi:hypothetical protein
MMKPPFYEPDLIQWLQLSGEYIGRMDDHPETRADWILFLVDEVKGFISPEAYQALLEQLLDGTKSQLEAAGP